MGLATKFTSSRMGSSPVLQGVLLKGENGKFDLYSTNLSSYFHATLPAKGEGSLKNIIDTRRVLEFVNLLDEGDVEIEFGEKQTSIRQGKTHGTFPVLPQEDFPLPPVLKEEEQKVGADFFLKNIPLVLFSASKDESRPVLSGINFINTDEDLFVVSTDGFRLSLLKMAKNSAIQHMLLPAQFLAEVLHQVKGEKEVGLTFSEEEKMARLRVGENEFMTRLIEGDFPPYERVIPTETKTTVLVDREEFMKKIKLVAVFAREFSNIVICEVGKKEVFLRPKTEGAGDNNTQIDAEIKGDTQKVAFNYKFLVDFLNTATTKQILIEILRSDAPVVFKEEGRKDYLHIIMPVRIQE